MNHTSIQTSSLEAYSDIKATGKHSRQVDFILSKLQHGRDYTLREIQKLTNFEINIVSGRVNDMKHSGLLKHSGKKRNCSITGKLVQPVRLPSVQLDLLEAA